MSHVNGLSEGRAEGRKTLQFQELFAGALVRTSMFHEGAPKE
jgi:hypothetical protein